VGNVRGIVPTHRHSHQNGQQSEYVLHRCVVDCRPGGRQGDTERAVTRWQRPMASGVGLDMLNRVMHSVLLQCTRVTINMACDRVTFVRRRHLFLIA
jgi:hypothetical protein